MNSFDAAVCIVAIIAVITGFNAGLLRSMATILGYVSAMPIAVAATSFLSPYLSSVGTEQSISPWSETSLLFFALFLVTGMALGTAMRLAISETVGPSVSIPDRLAGSALGAVRVALVAVTIVLIFDQLIPSDRQPGFLVGSKLRPILSVAAQKGLKSLPPDVTAYIDRLKREQRI